MRVHVLLCAWPLPADSLMGPAPVVLGRVLVWCRREVTEREGDPLASHWKLFVVLDRV